MIESEQPCCNLSIISGSTYTTIALALERLNAMTVRQPSGPSGRSVTCRYPTNRVMLIILLLSSLYNSPRFFETAVETVYDAQLEQINNTGDLIMDYVLVNVSPC